MYGNIKAADQARAHFGAIGLRELQTQRDEDPYTEVSRRINELVDHGVIGRDVCAQAIHALKVWMAEMPTGADPRLHAEEFYAQFEGSEFNFIP